MFLPVST